MGWLVVSFVSLPTGAEQATSLLAFLVWSGRNNSGLHVFPYFYYSPVAHIPTMATFAAAIAAPAYS